MGSCDESSVSEFKSKAYAAHAQSVETLGKTALSLQKRDMMVSLYKSVPLADRWKVRELLDEDFRAFGYDPGPRDLFPELQD